MSLTSQLANDTSPVSHWMRARVRRDAAAAFVRTVNDDLAARPPLVADRGAPATVGRAFDLAFRWSRGPLDARAPLLGARLCATLGWAEAEALARGLIRVGDKTRDPGVRLRCAIALSWFEHAYRTGTPPADLRATFGAPATREVAWALLRRVPPGPVADLAALVDTLPTVWADMRDAPFVPNPTFAGSRDVDGADADWILGATLWECKVSWRPRPFAREHLLQGIGYALLDYDDRYRLTGLGWYFARQQTRLVRPLSELLVALCDTGNLRLLRADFRRAIGAGPTDI